MKFDELTLDLVRTDLQSQTTRNLENKIIFVAFNFHGTIPSWLEYSCEKDATFCLPCFLFNKPSVHFTQCVFTIDGFKNWRNVRNRKDCVFLSHIGKDPNSFHRIAEKSYKDLKNQSQHI
jgi:hypothetical protein